jgi:glycosyltransferase involved in cell wall biosynthesis
MRQASVLVTPSRSEAFGLTNIEAMSVGTPVIGSAVGGIADVIQDGINGFLVPPDVPEILADAITRVLADSALRQRLSRAARERFLDVFEQRAVIAEQANWLESVISESSLAAIAE